MGDYNSASEWYEHYKSIQVDDLIAEFLSRELRRDVNVPVPLRMAAEERIEEIEDAMCCTR